MTDDQYKKDVRMLCDCCCDCVALSGYECDCEDLCWFWVSGCL